MHSRKYILVLSETTINQHHSKFDHHSFGYSTCHVLNCCKVRKILREQEN